MLVCRVAIDLLNSSFTYTFTTDVLYSVTFMITKDKSYKDFLLRSLLLSEFLSCLAELHILLS